MADKNNYVALLIGKFDLDRWLSGEFVDTLVSATFDDWRKSLNKDLIQNFSLNSIDELKGQLEKMFNNFLDKSQIQLCKALVFVENENKFNFKNDFWEPLAERDASGLAEKVVNDGEKAEWLVKLLFRKHPTAARMRRIWTTTLEFFQKTVLGEIIPEYFEQYGPGIRRKRIEIGIDRKLEPNRSYQVKIGEKVLDFFAIDDGSRLISISNLELIGNSFDKIKEKLNEHLKVWDEKDNRWQSLKINKCELANVEYLDYNPWIDIYSYPEQFMILIPARDSSEIASRVIESYEEQFSKVRDRLPLHLGLVFFPRKAPLYAALDAGKRILDRFSAGDNRDKRDQKATVKSVNVNKNRTVSLNLRLEKEKFRGKELKWLIDCSTGDPGEEDRWYPYVRVDDEVDISRRQWIPRGTVFRFRIVYNDPGLFSLNGEKIKIENGKPATMDWVKTNVEKGMSMFKDLGIGGMNTRGMGRIKVLNLTVGG